MHYLGFSYILISDYFLRVRSRCTDTCSRIIGKNKIVLHKRDNWPQLDYSLFLLQPHEAGIIGAVLQMRREESSNLHK